MINTAIVKVVETAIRKELTFPANVQILLNNEKNPVEMLVQDLDGTTSLVIPLNGMNVRKEKTPSDLEGYLNLGKFSYKEKNKETLYKIIMLNFERFPR